MDYDSIYNHPTDSVFCSILTVLLILLCILHIWFSAAASAFRQLGGGLQKLTESHPKLQYYLEKGSGLRNAVPAGEITFSALLCFILYSYTWNSGMFRSLPAWLALLLPALVVLLAALLLDGIGKGIGRRKPEEVLIHSVGLVRLTLVLTAPMRCILSGADRLFGGKAQARETVTEEQILQMVNAGNATGAIEEQQRDMINNIFEFDDMPISEVMTHRRELVAVSVDTEIEAVVDLARSENYSRMPVYQGSIDNVIGILNTKDLLGLIGCQNISGFNVRFFLREALFVPETAKCDDVLSDMSRKKMQMAIVVDEYGGTAGAVCMEDILEEIVGNIQDEYDEEEAEVHRITDALYTIDGHADPEDALPLLGQKPPEDMPFDTMSGFMMELLGRIPEAGENPSVEWQNIRFTVLSMEENWIAKIKAEILPELQPEGETLPGSET